MVEIDRKTFTVTVTGVGRPDYSPRVATTKLVTETLQTAFSVSSNQWITTNTTVSISLYTIPTGYKLHIGSILITCNESLIQKLAIVYRLGSSIPRLLDNFLYDTRGDIVYGPESAIEIPAGGQLEAWLWNNDTDSRFFQIYVQGFLERVA